MTIHSSKVIFRDNKYYFDKGRPDEGKPVTAQVLFFSDNGALECDFQLKDGIFHGVQKLYKDAYYQLSSIENYKNGIPDGLSKFYRDGIIYKETVYEDGQLTFERIINE
jgi:hypothetical protein